MIKIINDWQHKRLRCHECGTTKSVKYETIVHNPVEDDKPLRIALCNKCALSYEDGSNLENEEIVTLFRELLAYSDDKIIFIDIPYEEFINVATAVIKLGYRKQK